MTMTIEEAKEIIDKKIRCRDRIIDTRYCEEHSCKGCELNVTHEEVDKAYQILKGE